jgi:hypothetical protein
MHVYLCVGVCMYMRRYMHVLYAWVMGIVYVNIHTYVHIHTYIDTYIHTRIMGIVYVNIHIHTYIHTYIHTRIMGFVYVNIHTHIYSYILIYIHTYIDHGYGACKHPNRPYTCMAIEKCWIVRRPKAVDFMQTRRSIE